MLITPQYVKIKWNVKNRKYFEELGYRFTKYKDEFTVKVEDLSKSNRTVKIQVLCDYCYEIYFTTAANYYNSIKLINKSCCDNVICMKRKREEATILKYSVKSVSQLKEVKEKVKQTNMQRFGVEYVLQSEQIREKSQKTMLQKYGVENYAQSEEYLVKSKETSLRKYGVDSPNKSKKVQMKKNETMYKNGTTKTSKQQEYIYNLYGGELNYPVNISILDIAFPDEKIYIEYDGSGHDLCVKKDNVSQKEFEAKERKRYFALKYQGWKSMRIISKYDKLPKDEILLDILKIGLEWLNQGHYWINFVIDENIIETSRFRKFYNYGEINRLVL